MAVHITKKNLPSNGSSIGARFPARPFAFLEIHISYDMFPGAHCGRCGWLFTIHRHASARIEQSLMHRMVHIQLLFVRIALIIQWCNLLHDHRTKSFRLDHCLVHMLAIDFFEFRWWHCDDEWILGWWRRHRAQRIFRWRRCGRTVALARRFNQHGLVIGPEYGVRQLFQPVNDHCLGIGQQRWLMLCWLCIACE